jgi:hypothetical protein
LESFRPHPAHPNAPKDNDRAAREFYFTALAVRKQPGGISIIRRQAPTACIAVPNTNIKRYEVVMLRERLAAKISASQLSDLVSPSAPSALHLVQCRAYGPIGLRQTCGVAARLAQQHKARP